MALRFRRRIRIAPGVHLNLGMHGAGLSLGPRGLHIGMNRRGIYTSAGIPGTGLYAVHHCRGVSEEQANAEGSAVGILLGVLIGILLLILLVGIAANLTR